ncbi:MAG TPA: hypothetical protein VIS76_03890 [Pseudomonadales bacterium]
MRDIKGYERAMRRHGPPLRLTQRIDAAVTDLNEDRPRPVLGGRTAREAFERDRVPLPPLSDFIKEVNRTEKKLRE